jgi:hypothetical protein
MSHVVFVVTNNMDTMKNVHPSPLIEQCRALRYAQQISGRIAIKLIPITCFWPNQTQAHTHTHTQILPTQSLTYHSLDPRWTPLLVLL